jgi:hypothetical protein
MRSGQSLDHVNAHALSLFRAGFPALRSLPVAALVALWGAGCAPAPTSVDEADSTAAVAPTTETEAQPASLAAGAPPAYQDVEETFSNEVDQNRWFDLKRQLRQNFDDICGDTFCEGDFSNLESMSLRCSASTRTHQLKTCVWLFAGSYETVTASTGNIRPTAKFFACKLPVQGTVTALLDALLAPSSRGPLWQPLPGTTQSIYDSLADCL